MNNAHGIWDCVTDSPLGIQKTTLTLLVDGSDVTGSNAAAEGSLEINNGKVEGNKLTWTMNLVEPMALKLKVEVHIDGDILTGTIKAGAFPMSTMTGMRLQPK